jgi:hypothetical protein
METNEEILKNAPELATHYGKGSYYKITGHPMGSSKFMGDGWAKHSRLPETLSSLADIREIEQLTTK